MSRLSGNRHKKDPKAKMNKISLMIAAGLAIVISGVLLVQGVSLRQRNVAYAQQEDIYSTMIESEKQRSLQLSEQMNYVQTKKYVEEIARDKLNLVYPGEVIFVEK